MRSQERASSNTGLLVGGGLFLLIVVVGSVLVFQRVRTVAEEQIAEAQALEEAKARIEAGNLFIGDEFPDIEFETREGEVRRIGEFLGKDQYVVVNFHHPDCPCAANCGRLIAGMTGENGYDDVQVVGLLASGYDDPRVWNDLEAQRQEGIVTFPVFVDRGQKVMKQVGAKRTPEIWVLDKDGRVAYHGAPESTLFPGSVDHRYLLREAIDALRAGTAPEIQSTPSIGCLIE